MTITTENITRRGSNETVFLVKRAGTPIGLVTKFRDTRTTKNPWKAFRLDGSAEQARPNTMLGAFYGPTGKREALIAVSMGTPATSGPGLDADAVLEIQVNGSWTTVSDYIFRSWTGARRINGTEYAAPVYVLGTTEIAKGGR
jgi:hypothetical protein